METKNLKPGDIAVGDLVRITYDNQYWQGLAIVYSVNRYNKDVICVNFLDGRSGGFRVSRGGVVRATQKEILQYKLSS